MTTYKGVLIFHSETGTEGGYWAMQDEKFMGIPNDSRKCVRCGCVWSHPTEEAEPVPKFFYVIEDENGKYTKSFDEPHRELDEDNDRHNRMHNTTARACYVAGHQQWVEMYPEGIWSYDGLHVLKDGDKLTVFNADDTVKWKGEIKLQQHELFTEDASGMWIHADQIGEDRDRWAAMFFGQMKCELETAD